MGIAPDARLTADPTQPLGLGSNGDRDRRIRHPGRLRTLIHHQPSVDLVEHLEPSIVYPSVVWSREHLIWAWWGRQLVITSDHEWRRPTTDLASTERLSHAAEKILVDTRAARS